jgi:hypothetical protein
VQISNLPSNNGRIENAAPVVSEKRPYWGQDIVCRPLASDQAVGLSYAIARLRAPLELRNC